MKSKSFIIITILTILTVLFFLFKEKILSFFKKKSNEKSDKSSTELQKTAATQKYNSTLFPLKKGDKGEVIEQLQAALNKKLPTPYLPLTVDGDFGKKTETAVQAVFGHKTVSEAEFNKLINPFA
ncbi:MAG: hypothetical protein PHS93_09210 [Candidatus Omnitrophica bacterium]|nr:hypothetical protein [Candidatus Omnitrophota bacterium]MDD5353324.1 hypothetical protein [Candidatus Omnitrophota bacterium]MDD5551408.1 hypothetical protein [Candidatus Omnitrophota bacterium]